MPPSLAWAAAVDRDALAADGYDLIEFDTLRREVVEPSRRIGPRRKSLENPAQAWLDRVARAHRLAVVGIRIRDVEDLAVLHGYVLDPALRAGIALTVESEQRLSRLVPEQFVDPEFAYPYALERALHAAMRLYRGEAGGEPAGGEPARSAAAASPPASLALDPEQRRAVDAHDGVVQVIAPAGSGKTAVLIERVRELLRRGVAAERILCTTFNRDARVELQDRLRSAGVQSAAARTFHSIGWWLMREEGLARPDGVRELSFNQWRRLCAIGVRETGTWIDPADARAAISGIKLGSLATPHEFRGEANRHRDGDTLALIYELYERQLADARRHDFDDLVLTAVRALRADRELRRRWQSRFRHVLVDEYQDIEPAQELLVRILAAPEDGFFCVGDEDQTLYGWRRASVRRIVELDLVYPGLERISLAHNYRCPPDVVEASRRLVEHNAVRFPKPINAASAAGGGAAALRLCTHNSQQTGAGEIANALVSRERGEVVVLARTTNLLRTVALACSVVGIRIAAPDQVFEPAGARGALEAYVRLCADPTHADPEDVARVCRTPSRGLPLDAEGEVAARLRAGRSFTGSLAALAVDARQRLRLEDGGRILDTLAAITDAASFISYLRGPGGLDDYFAEHERAFGATERIELEVLQQASREAVGKTLAEYADELQGGRDALAAIRDDAHGIELTTIHRAKGREWREVHVFGCEENQLPHARSLEVGEQERAAGEGIEAERRLAYVAFTRARESLVIHTSADAPSRFLVEAGLIAPSAERSPRGAPPRRRQRGGRRGGPSGDVVSTAQRIGLSYALRTAGGRRAALEGAADVIEDGLLGPETMSTRMSVTQLLRSIESVDGSERGRLLQRAGIDNGKLRLTRLDATTRSRLVQALRELAEGA